MTVPASPVRSALADVSNKDQQLAGKENKVASSPFKNTNKAALFRSPRKTLREPEPILDENPDRYAASRQLERTLVHLCSRRGENIC